MPRIAHIAAAPEFVQLIMIHELRHLGAVARSVVVCSGGEPLNAVAGEGFAVHEIPISRKLSPWRDLATVCRLYRLLRAEQFDVVHTYTPKAGLLGQIAAWLARVPVRLHSCRGLLYTRGMSAHARTLFRTTDRITNRIAHRTLFVSGADMRYSVESGLCRAERARYTGNGVDLTVFDPRTVAPERCAEIRAALGIPPSATIALTVGRFVGAKGYPELARAARMLAGAHPDLWFVWVAPVMSGEADIVDASTLDDPELRRVVRVPFSCEMPAMYMAADLLIHPSHREGVPRAVMEAMVMGLPVVATDIPGCRELIVPAARYRLVPVGDAAALAREVSDLVGSGTCGVARTDGTELDGIREMLDQARISQRVWRVYEELLPDAAPLARPTGSQPPRVSPT